MELCWVGLVASMRDFTGAGERKKASGASILRRGNDDDERFNWDHIHFTPTTPVVYDRYLALVL